MMLVPCTELCDTEWCEKNCRWFEPQRECWLKFAEQLNHRKGVWQAIKRGEKGYSAGDFRCSVCGKANPCYRLTDFCPNCGADMRNGDLK